jgi:hypothetical protein
MHQEGFESERNDIPKSFFHANDEHRAQWKNDKVKRIIVFIVFSQLNNIVSKSDPTEIESSLIAAPNRPHPAIRKQTKLLSHVGTVPFNAKTGRKRTFETGLLRILCGTYTENSDDDEDNLLRILDGQALYASVLSACSRQEDKTINR